MLRLFFILITLCGVSIAIRPDITQSSAGCPVFVGGEWDEYYTSPLYITSRPDGRQVIGRIMPIQLRPNQVINAARHHIIPVSLLQRFWNTMLERSQINNDFRTFLSAILYLCQEYPPPRMAANLIDALESFISRLISGEYHIGTLFTHNQIRYIQTIQAIYVWMPGNIFIGPSSRHDDPSNGFESDAVGIVDPNNFRRLRELNSLMATYIHNQNLLNEDGCVGPVRMNRVVELIRGIRHDHTLYNGGHWLVQPDLLPMIQWENDPNVVLQVAQQQPRLRRHSLYSDNQSCQRPLVQTISNLPDRYCILAPYTNGKKIIAAVL